MRETTGPVPTSLPEDGHLLQPVMARAEQEPERVVAAYRSAEGLTEVGAAQLYDRVRQLARGLIATGVQPGDRVALMSHTRLEWVELDYAILAVGGVTVPVYETSSAEQLRWIVTDSGAVLTVVETQAMRALCEAADGDHHPVLVIDEGGLDALARRGAGASDTDLDSRMAALRTTDLATIIYTSGTTGRPKGCMLTHGNLRANVFQNIDAVRSMLMPEETGLLFLPLAHSLAKIILLVGVELGVKGVFATDMAHLAEELPIAEPTMIVAVPRVFEKVFNSAQHQAEEERHGSLFEKAAEVAVEWSRRRLTGHPGPVAAVEHAVFDPLVYRKLRAVFGGRLRFAFSGGGPLGERLTHFFNGIGVRIFEGYGLTETGPTLTVNRADGWRPGTVGRPVAGTTIRIADDGEILAKGPQVFQGYWHNPSATSETFDQEGWFRTGDVGELDDNGFLRITGRKKELLVTAAGKNVAPAPLEDRLRAHPLISQTVVVGDGRPFVGALITLDDEVLRQWAVDHGHLTTTATELCQEPELRAAIQAAIDPTNASVSRAESIREFAVLPHDLTIEAGELTPTLKVRRAVVEKEYADVIESLYRG